MVVVVQQQAVMSQSVRQLAAGRSVPKSSRGRGSNAGPLWQQAAPLQHLQCLRPRGAAVRLQQHIMPTTAQPHRRLLGAARGRQLEGQERHTRRVARPPTHAVVQVVAPARRQQLLPASLGQGSRLALRLVVVLVVQQQQ